MKPFLDVLEDWEQKIREGKKNLAKKFEMKKAEKFIKRRHFLREYMWKAGIVASPKKISTYIVRFIVLLNLFVSVYLVGNFTVNYGFNIPYMLMALLFTWVVVSAVVLFVLWMGFYFFVDILIYTRKVEIENVLPDFLQLTSANIRAGMPIDKALWFAVRPRFGVLSREIEEVAKRTFVGEELEVALREFASKYDSVTLRRSMYLLIEGLKAGGEVGILLDRIATNIQQVKSMKREMAANVTTYVIFISVAVVVGAPFLFSLANTLIGVIQQIGGAIGSTGGASTGISFQFSPDVISLEDFRIFAFTTLTVTSISAAAIISTIQKGSVKGGLKYIPIFIISTLTLFTIFSAIFSGLFSGFF